MQQWNEIRSKYLSLFQHKQGYLYSEILREYTFAGSASVLTIKENKE